jgi:hypothetical protein
VVRRILLLFLLFDPVPLYLANTVSSDALFTGLSLVWLTELLWLIRRPSWRRLPLQLFLLLLIFYTRYNALYYPVIAAVAFLLTRKGLAFKLTGTVASVLVLVAGMMVVREINRQQTGVKTFSAFSGWQMANNALYVYPYITVDPAQLPSSECRELDSIVRASPPHQLVEAWYMWDPESPLKRYMVLRRQREHIDYFTAWNRVGPVFSQYGYYLMLHHPLLFAREYGWPSARTFFYPPLDVLQRYNEGHTEVDATAKDWFHYRSTMVRCRCAPDLQEWILSPFQPFWALLNLAFPIAAIFFLVKGRSRRRTDIGQHPDLIQPINIGRHTDLVQHPAGKQHPLQHPDDRDLRNGILLTGVYWGVNAAFSIFATPNVFRYQVGPMIWLFVLTLLIVDALSHRWTPGSAAQKE